MDKHSAQKIRPLRNILTRLKTRILQNGSFEPIQACCPTPGILRDSPSRKQIGLLRHADTQKAGALPCAPAFQR